MNVHSILCLLDIETGEVTELKRFAYRMEAPFFRGENEPPEKGKSVVNVV
ncbi:MAG: hypothetical protein IJD06_06660 [Clostridia bacterium]|nr:hypothetical protein [Clostridia bacterium]